MKYIFQKENYSRNLNILEEVLKTREKEVSGKVVSLKTEQVSTDYEVEKDWDSICWKLSLMRCTQPKEHLKK